VRAKVEHVFLVMKRIFGWAKVRYSGLAKNTTWLFISGGLANLYSDTLRLALAQSSPLEASEPVPAFRLAPECFNLFAGPLREAIAARSTQPPYPLMDRLSSDRLRGYVRGDASSYKGGQKRFGKIAFLRPHCLNPQSVCLLERIK